MQVASSGYQAGLVHVDSSKEDVPLTVRLDRATRSDLERIQSLKVAGKNGRLVALRELRRGRGHALCIAAHIARQWRRGVPRRRRGGMARRADTVI